MKVILLEELKGRGGEGDVIEVANGFANNYLLPGKRAVKATPGNLKQLQQRTRNIAKREEARMADAAALKEKLEGAQLRVAAKVGDEGQLFGSVTAQMIVDAVKNDLDLDIDRRRIEMGHPIKVVGEHAVQYSIYREVKATLKLRVAAAETFAAEEAEAAQAAAQAEEAEAPAEEAAAE